MILETQVRALDTAIQQLDAQITSARDPRVNEPFREAWRAYTARWQVQRDSWLGAGDITRKFGFSESTFENYQAAYQRWLADFQKRIAGAARRPPPAALPIAPTSFFGSMFQGTGTLILTALIVGGVYYIYKTKGNRKNG